MYHMDDGMARLDAATERYERSAQQAEKDKNELFDAMAETARRGASPEEIAARTPFTPAYVRRKLRERGVPPLPPGPKRQARQ